MNNTAKHTPGPWYPHCAEADHCLSSSVWGAEPGNQVAVIGGKKLDEMNANAHLISAAPAMYEALLWAKQYLRMPNFHYDNSYNAEQWAGDYNKLCEALAQAEGK